MKKLLFILLSLKIACSLISSAPYLRNSKRPVVSAHRGAMGEFPEHTLDSYSSAFYSSVDFVELDLQLSKDGHLVCSHDPTLGDTTDVADHPEFAARKGNFSYGLPYEVSYNNDYLIHDFSLQELTTLKIR